MATTDCSTRIAYPGSAGPCWYYEAERRPRERLGPEPSSGRNAPGFPAQAAERNYACDGGEAKAAVHGADRQSGKDAGDGSGPAIPARTAAREAASYAPARAVRSTGNAAVIRVPGEEGRRGYACSPVRAVETAECSENPYGEYSCDTALTIVLATGEFHAGANAERYTFQPLLTRRLDCNEKRCADATANHRTIGHAL